MSLVRTSGGTYQSSLLGRVPWLRHSFGTALAAPPPGARYLKQIHSNRVLEAAQCDGATQGDALVTATPGVALGIRTADCIPLLIADSRRRAVAAVHAGWKGTLLEVAGAAVNRLRSDFGSQPVDLIAAFGPSIGPCCFEVGPEVAVQFAPLFPERQDLDRQTKVDLRLAVLRQLGAAGIPAGQIDATPPCTFCGGSEFHSWRRDRQADLRMLSTIAIAP